MPNTENEERSLIQRQSQLLLSVAALCLVGLSLFALSYDDWHQFASIVGAGILVAIASTMVGAFCAFLLGVPRRMQSEPWFAAPLPESVSRQRTSLEYYSGVLLKVVAVILLTQIAFFRQYLSYVANGLAPAFGDDRRGRIVGLATAVSFFIIGFASTYSIVRSELAKPNDLPEDKHVPRECHEESR